jgi:hypothetical protein
LAIALRQTAASLGCCPLGEIIFGFSIKQLASLEKIIFYVYYRRVRSKRQERVRSEPHPSGSGSIQLMFNFLTGAELIVH